jgi:hypothetical protein
LTITKKKKSNKKKIFKKWNIINIFN